MQGSANYKPPKTNNNWRKPYYDTPRQDSTALAGIAGADPAGCRRSNCDITGVHLCNIENNKSVPSPSSAGAISGTLERGLVYACLVPSRGRRKVAQALPQADGRIGKGLAGADWLGCRPAPQGCPFPMLRIRQVKHLAHRLGVESGIWKRVAEAPERWCEELDPARPGQANEDTRIVLNVVGPLRKLQSRMLRDILLPALPVSQFSHGGVRGRHIKTNVEPHLDSTFVFTTDISNFYPSISHNRVYRLFRQGPFSARLTLLGFAQSSAPRPPSCPGADYQPNPGGPGDAPHGRQIAGACRKAGLVYTRYVDDLTISGPYDLQESGFADLVQRILEEHGFVVNPAKHRFGPWQMGLPSPRFESIKGIWMFARSMSRNWRGRLPTPRNWRPVATSWARTTPRGNSGAASVRLLGEPWPAAGSAAEVPSGELDGCRRRSPEPRLSRCQEDTVQKGRSRLTPWFVTGRSLFARLSVWKTLMETAWDFKSVSLVLLVPASLPPRLTERCLWMPRLFRCNLNTTHFPSFSSSFLAWCMISGPRMLRRFCCFWSRSALLRDALP